MRQEDQQRFKTIVKQGMLFLTIGLPNGWTGLKLRINCHVLDSIVWTAEDLRDLASL